jgi:NitT/TauT family transport system ATP-binding protein
VIKFLKVTKSFNKLRVLGDLSFNIKRNEIVSIIGPSGIGKTTILRLIAGILKPDSGKIELMSSKIGYIFQEPRLLPWRSVIENISLGLRARGIGKKEARESAGGWVKKLNLSSFENYYPAQLSGGMMQRLSIGRALAIEPEILLMDEPFSNLDVKLKDSLLTMIENILREYQITVVYVTHDILEAVRLADRVFMLHPEHLLKELKLDDDGDGWGITKDFLSEVTKKTFQKRHNLRCNLQDEIYRSVDLDFTDK